MFCRRRQLVRARDMVNRHLHNNYNNSTNNNTTSTDSNDDDNNNNIAFQLMMS